MARKKVAALIITVLLLFSTVAAFPDLDAQYGWAEEAIASMATRGIIQGYDDGTFRPDASVTRHEALTIAKRIAYTEDLSVNFTDGDEYQPLKRYETAVLLYSLTNGIGSAFGTDDELPYTDADIIPSDAKSSVEYAFKNGLMIGTDENHFEPDGELTRAMLATVLYRAEKLMKSAQDRINLLIVGNSFSRDTTHYLHDIADEYGGVSNDVYLLYKGSATLTHHWDTRETTDDVNTLYINGESRGYTNLKTVLTSGVEFDYIALQHYPRYPETETEIAWTPVMENLTEYVHNLAPDAEIIFHEIWTFEKGNCYTEGHTLTDETQAEVSEYFSRMTDQVTVSAGERIGTGKLRVINSNALFQSARHYEDENGVRVLGGSYPREKMLGTFYSTEDYTDYPVGQGMMLDEEAAAGMVRLNRDGNHASLLGRYMMGCMWYKCLTGNDARTIGFVPEPESISTYFGFADTDKKAFIDVRYDTPSAENLELVRNLAHQAAADSEWKK